MLVTLEIVDQARNKLDDEGKCISVEVTNGKAKTGEKEDCSMTALMQMFQPRPSRNMFIEVDVISIATLLQAPNHHLSYSHCIYVRTFVFFLSLNILTFDKSSSLCAFIYHRSGFRT